VFNQISTCRHSCFERLSTVSRLPSSFSGSCGGPEQPPPTIAIEQRQRKRTWQHELS
jgi:hypothetical protein